MPGNNLNLFNVKTRTQTKLGLDLKGGVHAVLQARPAPGQKVDSDVLSGLRDTIERRVNSLGVSEPIIQTQGSDKIVVELPGVQDPEAAVRVLKQTALLELVGSQTALPVGTHRHDLARRPGNVSASTRMERRSAARRRARGQRRRR